MNYRTIAVFALAILAACPSGAFANPSRDASAAFPLRPQYIDVAVLETAELHARFHEVIVVDVRSQYEYDTLRIRDALLLPVTESRFIDEVRRLRGIERQADRLLLQRQDLPEIVRCRTEGPVRAHPQRLLL